MMAVTEKVELMVALMAELTVVRMVAATVMLVM